MQKMVRTGLPFKLHQEHHHHGNIGWLRASVLGANDGLLSTASLLAGMAAGRASHEQILLAGVAALVAGAFSMAAGEYVSVSSQADTQLADLEIERRELKKNPDKELLELRDIYMVRGLDEALAQQVAAQLMQRDPLAAHARDELGLTEMAKARPGEAALASAASFVCGAIFPVLIAAFVFHSEVLPVLFTTTILLLVILGAVAAKAGGASMMKGALRVVVWGALSMIATSLIGHLLGQAAI
ncbi:MAG: VIT family protein [Acidithiobacillus sp.]|nr:VIT family protein [Acidithiobacillus sp.]